MEIHPSYLFGLWFWSYWWIATGWFGRLFSRFGCLTFISILILRCLNCTLLITHSDLGIVFFSLQCDSFCRSNGICLLFARRSLRWAHNFELLYLFCLCSDPSALAYFYYKFHQTYGCWGYCWPLLSFVDIGVGLGSLKLTHICPCQHFPYRYMRIIWIILSSWNYLHISLVLWNCSYYYFGHQSHYFLRIRYHLDIPLTISLKLMGLPDETP